MLVLHMKSCNLDIGTRGHILNPIAVQKRLQTDFHVNMHENVHLSGVSGGFKSRYSPFSELGW